MRLYSNELTGEIPVEICDFANLNNIDLKYNQLCPPYPECLNEEDIGSQDTSECFEDVEFSINLIAGWNWISFNVNPEDASLGSVLATVSETATFINSQSSGTATNYGAYGWYGGLTTLNQEMVIN